MRLPIIFFSLFFLFTFEANAKIKLKVGETYLGVIEDVFEIKNDIPLPPGKWRVRSSNIGSSRMYASGWLSGPNNSWIFFSLPLRNHEGMKWKVDNSRCEGSIANGGQKLVLGQRNEWRS